MPLTPPKPREAVLQVTGEWCCSQVAHSLSHRFSWFSALLLGSVERGSRRRLCEPSEASELQTLRRNSADSQVSGRQWGRPKESPKPPKTCSKRTGPQPSVRRQCSYLPGWDRPPSAAGPACEDCFPGSQSPPHPPPLVLSPMLVTSLDFWWDHLWLLNWHERNQLHSSPQKVPWKSMGWFPQSSISS